MIELEPVLIETYADGFVTEWYCEPPPKGQAFRVLLEEWPKGLTVRRIFEYVIIDDTPIEAT